MSGVHRYDRTTITNFKSKEGSNKITAPAASFR